MKLRHICNANSAVRRLAANRLSARLSSYYAECDSLFCGMFPLTAGSGVRSYGIFILTHMPLNPDAKRKALQTTGTLNPRAAQVRHPLFEKSSFFDPEDLLQLKYETLRAVEIERCPIAKAARDFGLSRPTIYQAQVQFQQQGLEGLLPHKRGPKAAHKLTEEILLYFQAQRTSEPELKAEELARRVRQRYEVKLHPRTIQKALNAKAKRGRRA
jgi:transposase